MLTDMVFLDFLVKAKSHSDPCISIPLIINQEKETMILSQECCHVEKGRARPSRITGTDHQNSYLK